MIVKFSTPAQKQLGRLPKTEAAKVWKKIQLLKTTPLAGKKLKGDFEGLRSIRAWPYRIIYHYSAGDKLLFIETIEHRQGVYK